MQPVGIHHVLQQTLTKAGEKLGFPQVSKTRERKFRFICFLAHFSIYSRSCAISEIYYAPGKRKLFWTWGGLDSRKNTIKMHVMLLSI